MGTNPAPSPTKRIEMQVNKWMSGRDNVFHSVSCTDTTRNIHNTTHNTHHTPATPHPPHHPPHTRHTNHRRATGEDDELAHSVHSFQLLGEGADIFHVPERRERMQVAQQVQKRHQSRKLSWRSEEGNYQGMRTYKSNQYP